MSEAAKREVGQILMEYVSKDEPTRLKADVIEWYFQGVSTSEL